jgi:hypothetical protein
MGLFQQSKCSKSKRMSEKPLFLICCTFYAPKSPSSIAFPSPLKRGKPEEATPLILRGTLNKFFPLVNQSFSEDGWGRSDTSQTSSRSQWYN